MSPRPAVEAIGYLSPAQQGILFHTLEAAEPGVYVGQTSWLLRGDLCRESFVAAWERVVARHGSLRAAFVWEGLEEPVQVVRREVPAVLVEEDWRRLDPDEQEARFAAWLAADRRRPFALHAAPLMRLALLRLGERSWRLVWSSHHLLLDGWSKALVLGEVMALYRGLRAGREPELPRRRPFLDYVDWLRRQEPDSLAPYWRRTLAGFATPTRLALDGLPAGTAASVGGSAAAPGGAGAEVRLSAADTAALGRLARATGVTPAAVAQAAWAVLLARWTGSGDVVFGAVVSGRPPSFPGAEEMVGMFINTLPLRVAVAAGDRVRDLLARVRARGLELLEVQHSPLVAVQGWSEVPRGEPLFESILVFENYPAEEADDGGEVEVADLRLAASTNYPLTVTVVPGRELALQVQGQRGLAGPAVVRRLAGQLRRLLAAMAAGDADARIGDLAMLGAAERHQVLVEWNDTAAARGPADLAGRIRERAAARPDVVAVAAGDGQVSYGELVRRADALAARLRALGAGPEVGVGVCLGRSPAMVTALLAVRATGGWYLPLDPALPAARLRELATGGGVALALAEPGLEEVAAPVAAAAGVPLLTIDGSAAEGGTPPDVTAGGRRRRPHPKTAVYTLFTSGSTGRPKGVQVEAAALGDFLAAMAREPGLAEDDVLVAVTTLSFDIAGLELWLPLLTGARVVIAGREEAADGERLSALVERTGATAVQATPATWRLLLEAGWPADPAGPRLRVLCGGEALDRALAERLLAAGGELWNLYGPTETTVWSTRGRVAAGAGPVSIGRPIENSRAYLVGPGLRPVPAGAAGELLIGGGGVARGYLGRPAATAERFVPDPFAGVVGFGGGPGGRLYRTGDLARFRPDGELEFLGRRDQQVKVRGFRIEPAEIEGALERHPEVERAAVVADRPAADGEARLVAFVVPRDGVPPAPKALREHLAALREHLAARLPEYMVPAFFAPLPALPLTANGKLDRRALAARAAEATAAGTEATGPRAAPRTPTEELVAQLWAEVLGVERVGWGESFVALGGHSLLATRLASRLRTVFAVDLPLRAVFEAPTVAAQAALVEEARGRARTAPPLVPVPRDESPPLSFAQLRLWFIDRLEPGLPAYNVPAAVRLSGPLAVPALAAALAELERRHEALRTTVATDPAGGPVQAIHPAPRLRPATVDLSGLAAPAGEEARLAAAEAGLPFDLGRGPLARAVLLRLGPDLHTLLVTLHHLIADRWSLEVLFGELAELVAAFAAGRPSPLAAPPVQYADYAVWQRRWLAGDLLDGQLAWWRRRLTPAPPPLALPTDRPRPPRPAHRGRRRDVRLPPATTAALRAFARRQGATPFMVALAGLYALLHRVTGQGDLAVGTPVANRSRREVEGLIGLFVNTLVLRVGVADGATFEALVARAREEALGAYAHQDLPFERLVEELQPERDLGRTPLVQLVFELVYAARVPAAPAGLALEWVEPETRTAKFDLLVDLVEKDGGLTGMWTYDADLFDASTVERLARRYGTLLAALLAEPGRPVAELPLVAPAERHQLLFEWAGRGDEAAPVARLERAFAAVAARVPDAVAVVGGDREPAQGGGEEWLTYGELAARAAALAAVLRGLGVGPEVRVGICLGRSPAAAVAILAVLAAGGAYLPLDPAHPRERLGWVLADAGAPVVISERALADRLPDDGPRRLLLDGSPATTLPFASAAADGREMRSGREGGDPVEDLHRIDAPRDHHVRPGSADAAAYVIYTSGSTGRPKGVVVTHRQVGRLFAATEPWFRFGGGDVWTLFHSLAFDFSVWELWGALLHGGRVVVVPEEARRDPGRFRRLLAEQGVTVLNQTPSAFRQLAAADEAAPAGDALALREVVFGGEALEFASLRGWFARRGDRRPRLVNMYGITETTVHVTYRPLAAADAARPRGSLIGAPIPDLRLHVLDRRLRPVPAGVEGELLVGGAGVARGYLGRPALTATRFVPDPYGRRPGARLYRSGDLARYRADGDLDYRGRIDHQVQIRGFRVELGEVETALVDHPAVREAVVLAREVAPGDLRTIAYLVPAAAFAASPASARELRAHLLARLPEYMVPAGFVVLDALPLTANGKVDRAALAAMPWTAAVREGGGGAGGGEETRAPRGPIEELTATVWAGALGVAAGSLGRDDGFFALGGHSLLATRVAAELGAVLGVEVPLRLLFEAPTLADLGEGLTALVAVGPEAAAGGAGREAVEAPPLVRVGRDRPPPLSFAQERLWFLDRLQPGSAVYAVPAAVRLEGALDVPALAAALAGVVARHEALRTTFAEAEGGPVQVIAPAPAAPPMPVVDLGALPAGRREGTAEWLARGWVERPFDLARGPLVRALLLRLAAGDHLAVVAMHHAVSDGWSIGVLVRELGALYRAAVGGAEGSSSLPPLPLQVADFAVWQRRRLSGPLLASLVAWWRTRLAGAPPRLDLPTDRPRPPVRSFRGATVRRSLPAATAARLSDLGRRRGATPFMVLLAAFDAVLARWSGRTDLVVGTPVAGRTRPEADDLIGLFVNTLVVRTDLGGGPTFGELVARVREVAVGAYAHQELPFEKLVAELAPERDRGREALFQVMFVLQNAPLGPLALPGLTVRPEPVEPRVAKFDLTLGVGEEESGGLTLALNWATSLWDRTTVDRLARHLETLLGAVAADPEARVDAVELWSPAERQQVAREWNDTAAAYPLGRTLPEWIAAQAAATPEATAVVFEGAHLSYRELLARARRLAGELRRRGAGPNERVAVCLERSLELVIALVAAVEAGAAYLPLDPEYPSERLGFVLAEAAPVAVVTTPRLAALLPAHEVPVVDPAAGAGESEDRGAEGGPELSEAIGTGLPRPLQADDLAYVIYTSGSTGRPKGVANHHRGIVNRLVWMQERYGLTPADRVLQKTPYSFDVSVWEFFWPLMVGATLVVARPGGHRDSAYLAGVIAREGVTTLHFVPSMLQAFAVEPRIGECTSLRRVMASGEALPAELVARFFGRLSGRMGCELHNLYGPTEAAVDVTSWACAPDADRRSIPIGRPVANTAIRIVDRRLRPVPVGVAGELLIGGVQPARGYLGRPGLTAERFVPDPFARACEGRGARLYRTGDLARHLPGGEVEFLGRLDHQVKLRGFRIELGEIEAVLTTHPEVREAAVILAEGEGGPRLVAWVTASTESRQDPADLRAWLAAKLPAHMVPASFGFLDALPLTASGKADRRSLAALAPESEARPEYLAPRTAVEEIVAGSFGALLGRDRVGADDGFFALGGHSLLATRLVSRVRAALGVELPLGAVFEAPTVAGLAARIEALRREGRPPVPPIRPAARGAREGTLHSPTQGTADAPLSYAQLRQWLLVRLDPETSAYHVRLDLLLTGDLDPAALAAALAALVRRHEMLRTTFVESAGEPVQRVAAAMPAPLAVVDLAGLADLAGPRAAAERRCAADAAARGRFDLACGPLLRAALVRGGPGEHLLALTFHHIVADGWSLGIVARELAALYAAAVAAEPSPLPPLPVQYADYAVWQRQWLRGEVLAGQLAWWRRRLEGVPPLRLPTDRPRPPLQTHRGRAVPLTLRGTAAAGLRALARRAGATPFMAVVAGFAALVSRYSGQRDFAVGTYVANRRWAEIEGLIGFFVNTLALRLDLGGDPAGEELVGRVRTEALGAAEHQDAPFEAVIEALSVERDPSRSPLFQVLVGFQNFEVPEVALPGLTLAPEPPAGDPEVHFDLTLWVREAGDGLAGTLHLNRDLFDRTTGDRLARHLERLLAAMAAAPERSIEELPLLSAAERAQCLVEWSRSGEAPAIDAPAVHVAFAARAAERPDAVAAVADGSHLSYGGLAARATAVAARLGAAGIGAEAVVGLCVPRGVEMLVGILGILRAGAAYLPIEPTLPEERIALLLADAGARAVVTAAAVEPRLPADAAVRVLLDRLDGDVTPSWTAGAPPFPPVPSGAAAYVVYTSGSTGRPKGVVVGHAALAAFAAAAGDLYRVGADDRVMQFASIAFDASAEEIYPALARGATLVVRTESMLGSAEAFIERCRREQVTVLDLPTAYWHELAARVDPTRAAIAAGSPPPALRLVILGGERALPERAAAWRRWTGPGVALVNTYGPTEATVVATTAAVTAADPRREPAIGRPLGGARSYVVDRRGRPVPAGAAGELWLGGSGVARGYLGRPAATAERFVPDPFAGEPGGRLYRTGDLARHRAGGELEFVGRVDDQVKVRGFRVEPDEAASALRAHPRVAAAVVLARGEGPARHLAAWVVPAEGGAAPLPTPAELRAFLTGRLPEYLVPSAFATVDALPLTATGKVDRRALLALAVPEADAGADALAGEPAAPAGVTEELLALAWREVLEVDRVGARDHFFRRGGHSLAATRLASRIRDLFAVELPLRTLFETPELAGQARLIERARREQGTRSAPAPVPVPRSPAMPLSFAQQRLWVIDRLQPGGAAYNLPAAVRLEGRLDVAALAASLEAIVHRHEVLRTTFAEGDDGPFQVIHPPAPWPLPVVDLGALPAGAAEAEATRRAAAEAARPFNLDRGPLLRTTLVRLAAERHELVVVLHHVAGDGWSVAVLVRELGAFYRAALDRVPADLPALPVQYADFAVWQRGWLAGDVLAGQLAWWRRRLSAGGGPPPLLELPTDRPRPAVQRFRGALAPFALPGLAARVRAAALGEGVTTFMVVLAAFQAVLHRWSGQSWIAVGSPIANRTRSEVEGLIGFFANTLVLAVDFAGAPTFRDLLARVREATLGAYAHQDLPFERLVEELEPRRDLGRHPLFQVALAVYQAAAAPLSLPGLDLSTRPLATAAAKFDLSLLLAEGSDDYRGDLEYDTALFDAATVRRFAGHLGNLLAGALDHPERPVARLALLGAEERGQLLGSWNATTTCYPRERTLHGLFAEIAARRPDAVAIVHGDDHLTYGELDRWAGRLASRLRAAGVAPGSRVGICLGRSPELIAATLAALASGAAYVPLDPDYPPDRLAFMVADAGLAAVVTDERSAAALPAFDAPCFLITPAYRVPERGAGRGGRLEHGRRPRAPGTRAPGSPRAEGEASAQSLEDDNLPASPETCRTGVAMPATAAAYVMYTSGSTGRPKGVVVTHRGVVRLVLGIDYVDLGPDDRVAQVNNPAFDASTFEIWAALLHGAAAVIIPRETVVAPAELAAFFRARGVTTLLLTVAVLSQVVREAPGALAPLAAVMFGGEAAEPRRLREVLAAGPPGRLINVYGPTESATFTTTYQVAEVTELAARAPSPPIGGPIANTRVHVLDRRGELVPVGVPGELCIAGDGLATGYHGRPALTAERFVPDPFAAGPREAGGRLYRSGDLARRRPDGTLDFLGRFDHQVKVHGYRVELGEIEGALAEEAGVGACAVLVHEVAPGDRRLVAYVGRAAGAAPEAGALRSALGVRLPVHMVPAAVVVLDGLPLTANGKVDRRALAALGWTPAGPAAVGAESVAPRTPVEELLAAVWADVLGVERAGIHDDFFAAGGHSLLATRVISRLRRSFGVELPLRALFEAPTVAGLAAAVERARAERRGLAAPPIVPAPRDRDLPLSFAQQRLWLIDRLDPGSAAYNVPVAVRLAGSLDPAALAAALAAVRRRHEVLRTTFAEGDEGPVQVIAAASRAAREPLATVDLTALGPARREAEAARLEAAEAVRGFDLGTGPLLRATLVRLAADDHLALLVLHHVVADGWSVGVLVRELSALYRAAASGEPSPLPPLPVQYADFALWQRGWLAGDTLAGQLDWWRGRLAPASAPPVPIELPIDRPRPPVQTFRGADRAFTLDPALAAGLRELGRREGATPFMVLLAGFGVLLHRYTGRSDLVVGSPIANRHRSEVEPLIGFFVNTLALPVEVGADDPFVAVLARVRETTLEGFARQDLPFEKLVEVLVPERDLSREPLVQVMFVHQNAPRAELALPGLTARPRPLALPVAKVDLTLAVAEVGEGVAGSWNYAVDLFDAVTIERMSGHLRTLLAAAAAEPERAAGALDLLTAAENRQLAGEWNATATAYPRAATVDALFAAVAAAAPDAVAVVEGHAHLSYGELARRSGRLARRLGALGVGPGARVALCLERSAALIEATLAVLAAGAAYVPLDPAYPAARLAFTLADSGARWLLTAGAAAEAVPEAEGVGRLLLDGDPRPLGGPTAGACPAAVPAPSRSGPEAAASAGRLAYLIYTSGSTGRPKGVAVPHRGIVRLVRNTDYLDFGAGDRVAHGSNPAFDAATFEIWGALLNGGRLEVAPRQVMLDPAALARFVAERGPTVLFLTTALFNQVVAAAGPGAPGVRRSLGSLRALFFGGEACDPGRVRQALGLLPPGARLLHVYGPTESTTYATWHPVDRVPARATTVPIGGPIANSGAHVLDRRLRLVPLGVSGELCVSGDGLAWGYHDRPRPTAERFVPDPYAVEPGGRLYRTGDLTRRRGDGAVEFLGRIDGQVKLRGFRIELGEIEAALAELPGVAGCAVVLREEATGERRLVAYLVAPSPAEIEPSALRAALRERLPEAMVPSAFATLPELPLTPNGKVDRRALAALAPTIEGAADADAFRPPATPEEEAVAAIWAGLLQRERVGVDDDFFALGGHSLMATQAVSRVRERFGVELPLRTLFEAPTVAGMASAVARLIAHGPAAGSPAAPAGPTAAAPRRRSRRPRARS